MIARAAFLLACLVLWVPFSLEVCARLLIGAVAWILTGRTIPFADLGRPVHESTVTGWVGTVLWRWATERKGGAA